MRAMLVECGFTPEAICDRLGIAALETYEPNRFRDAGLGIAEQAVDVLILLLMDGEFVPAEIVERLLPADAVRKLEALGLIASDPECPDMWFGGCILFPARGMWLASDRIAVPDRDALPASGDLVFPAAIENTVAFLATLPETPCTALLDLGTGSGIAALDGAKYASHTWGTDIAARSVHFAEFNRRLNGIQNATMLQGDLYAPVEGLTFDRIVAHPPYVPARQNAMIFRDGGEDGEQILRGIVEGLPRFLRPGGRFYGFVVAADCEGQWFEERLRLWLGGAETEFDLVLAAHTLTEPRDLTANSFLGQNTALEDIRYRHEIWRRRKVEFLFNGSVLIRRHNSARPAITARVLTGEGFTPRHVEWLLEWSTEVHDAERLERLMEVRPLLSPHAEMVVTHRVRDCQLAPEVFSVRSNRPFEADCTLEPWLVQIVAQCDGKTTWREHFERAKSAGAIPGAAPAGEFLAILEPLVSNGLLWIAEKSLPGLSG
uniref:Methyltransferase small n=1 Tax=Solibacter usitatus (strain Ellin6076) TaxID=234267 RepID=Q02CH5_SOLUE